MRRTHRSLAVSLITITALLFGSVHANAQARKVKEAGSVMTDEILDFFGLSKRVRDRVATRTRTGTEAIEKVTQTYEDEIITLTHARYEQGIASGEIFPIIKNEFVDGFIVGSAGQSQLFKGLQVSDLVRVVGDMPSTKVDKALASIENTSQSGFVAVGERHSGKTTLVESVEAVFRLRRMAKMQKTTEVATSSDGIFKRIKNKYFHRKSSQPVGVIGPNGEYIITVNPNHRLFASPKDEQEWIQSLLALKKFEQFKSASTIVFHFDDIRPFTTGDKPEEKALLLDRYVSMIKEDISPDKKIKFAFETNAAGYNILSKSEIGKSLVKIDVKEPVETIEQMTVIRRNMAITDTAGLINVSDADLSGLTLWAKRYGPTNPLTADRGISDVSIQTIEGARARIWSLLKNPNSRETDEVLQALEIDLKHLLEKFAKAKSLPNGAEARSVLRELDPARNPRSPILLLQKEIAEQKVRYARLKEIGREIEAIKGRASTLTPEQVKEEVKRVVELYREALTLNKRDLALALSEITHARVVDILRGSGRMTLQELRIALDEAIVGNERIKGTIMRIAAIVEQAFLTGKFNTAKPLFRYWISGKPGTGKTVGFKILGNFFDQMVFLSGAEYSEAMTKTKLIGSTPGYVNAGQPGTLSGPLQRGPSIRLILIDEAESIHESNLELLANGLDPARGQDGMGNDIDYTRTVMVFTSNAGQHSPKDLSKAGRRELIDAILAERPNIPTKLLDRMDQIDWADRITDKGELAQIVRKFIREANNDSTLRENLIRITVHPRAVNEMVERTLKESGSARLIDQQTATLVKDPILIAARDIDQLIGKPTKQALTTHRYLRSDGVIEGLELRPGDKVLLDFDQSKGTFFYRIVPVGP